MLFVLISKTYFRKFPVGEKYFLSVHVMGSEDQHDRGELGLDIQRQNHFICSASVHKEHAAPQHSVVSDHFTPGNSALIVDRFKDHDGL